MRRETGAAPSDLQLKIALHGTQPPLWRRLVLPSDTSLRTLHDAVQAAFGWQGGHLHLFTDESGRVYGDAARLTDIDLGFGPGSSDQHAIALGDVLPEDGARLRYVYDFGDDWEHRITLEKTLPRPVGAERAVRCVGGRRADVPAEDIGGVWGLGEVLARLEVPDRAGDGPFDELVAELRSAGYNPADFPRDGIAERLARLTPDMVPGTAKPPAGTRAGRGGGGQPAAEDTASCACGRCRGPGSPVDPGVDGPVASVPVLRPVTLAPGEDLAAAVRDVPLFESALRLTTWCREGRQVTASRVLRRALAREAVEELRLWEFADEGSPYAEATARARALKALRSAKDVDVLDEPWSFAVNRGLITISGGRAWGGEAADFAGENLLELWSVTLGDLLEEIDETGVLDEPLGELGELGELSAEIADALIGQLYDALDGTWVEIDDLRAKAREAGAEGPELDFLLALFATTFRDLAEELAYLGAVEFVPGDHGVVAAEDLLATPLNAVSGRGLSGSDAWSDASGRPRDHENGDRMRLTPLGRHGLRAYLMECGALAPLLGEYAEADADTLLQGLLGYSPEETRQEVEGWLKHRSGADAAVGLLDACAGDGPDIAARRAVVQPVLAVLDDSRALRVLRKAADSGIEGCRQVAAAALGARPEADAHADAARAEQARLWLFIDSLSLFVGAQEDEELLLGFQENPNVAPEVLEQRVDDLWRVEHPATAQVLAELGESLRDVDKRLAKRIRTAANKARSRR
ncbi:plasmid pRiA4b ORF-3 family protein [Streptomyces sp. NBC_00264]|uniref:plasmid pRiA4b ORF-3 family protein n=1 Tax=unclassified Streptomyces TaxID=2593676 RepID=UPI002257F01C|nr:MULTISPECIES: plasmid pRiA4b ORF-3 family protein [unclassified Streptomyces]MCX5161553.1 plasmid pRiA4b ORF-3 family protein [Streptomyces sp. NBC_00305]MCX5220076.1 plasmid pRiA4b ORF-3 family protein [Streptomyces sp. NBC_00264]